MTRLILPSLLIIVVAVSFATAREWTDNTGKYKVEGHPYAPLDDEAYLGRLGRFRAASLDEAFSPLLYGGRKRAWAARFPSRKVCLRRP